MDVVQKSVSYLGRKTILFEKIDGSVFKGAEQRPAITQHEATGLKTTAHRDLTALMNHGKPKQATSTAKTRSRERW
ncbi:hypothetical protein PHYPO_G00102530 [Pangasianodon hypophthalmus]|uniref:Uncharacterized protein n=1 Tax=Pangasianodon hypophthalmus TaxID=310915 RepID=A0A5N5PWJ5_PANHP|nr:hypothetical protein PHYPO_G00102530 [Pangasianodon hypophthalmus]